MTEEWSLPERPDSAEFVALLTTGGTIASSRDEHGVSRPVAGVGVDMDGVVVRDRHGFVVSGQDLTVDRARPPGWSVDRAPHHLETSVPGIFAAGDVRADSAKRVASAVGEGAMAVMLVHRYLAQP